LRLNAKPPRFMTQIKVFIGYSRTDNDYLQALKKHLTPLEDAKEDAKRIHVWYDGDLSPLRIR
jgi:hypothetical protein